MANQKLYDFPELRALRNEAEQEYYKHKKHVEQQSQIGNADSGSAALMEKNWAILMELNRALGHFEELNQHQTQQWKEWQTIVLIIVTAISLTLSIFYVWHGG